MNPPPSQDSARNEPRQHLVTQLLASAQSGQAQATNDLFPIVYDELRSIAGHFLADESKAQTLQATALVHEAYLRLIGPNQPPWENRAHFFGAAAKAIRRILTDHARARTALKRGSGAKPIPLDESLAISTDSPESLLRLDETLEKLAKLDAHKARVVELRFFAGLSVEQTALALGVSPSTIARDWQFARVWLHKEISAQNDARA